MAEPLEAGTVEPELVASFYTLSGAGFAESPRHDFTRRCEAAATAGFAGIGLHVDDLARTAAAGLDADGMRTLLEATGLRLVEIEFLAGWALDDNDSSLQATVAGIESVADALGGRHVSAGEFGPGDLDVDSAARRLAAVADRLDERGLLVAVEAFPWSALPNIRTAVDLVRRAGAPNVGLMIDVWHFFNGGAIPDDLAELPGAGIAAVQLNDGPRVHSDFRTHARTARMLPGEGDLDVLGLVQTISGTGFTGPWCVEVNTPEFRARPLESAAKAAADAAWDVLAAAGV